MTKPYAIVSEKKRAEQLEKIALAARLLIDAIDGNRPYHITANYRQVLDGLLREIGL